MTERPICAPRSPRASSAPRSRSARCSARSSRWRARSSARRRRRSSCSTRRPNELVFEAVVGEGEDTLLGMRFPAEHGIAGWVLATRTPLDHRGRAERPAVRQRRRRGHRLRAERADGRAAPPRRAGARRPRGARPPGASALLASRRWSCSACSRTRPRSPSISCCKARQAERLLEARATDGDLEVVARLAAAVDALEDERREAGMRLLRRSRRHARRVSEPLNKKKRPGRLYIPPGPRVLRRARATRRPAPRNGTLGDRALGDWAVGLDVRLVVRRLGDGAFGYWAFGDRAFGDWAVSLDLVVRADLLVRHLVLLLVRRAHLRGSDQQDRARARNLPSPASLPQDRVRCSRP